MLHKFKTYVKNRLGEGEQRQDFFNELFLSMFALVFLGISLLTIGLALVMLK